MVSMINEEEEEVQSRESTQNIKDSFSGFKNALQTGYDAGVTQADELSYADTSAQVFEKEAITNNDTLYEILIKHALLVIECDKVLKEIAFAAQTAEEELELLGERDVSDLSKLHPDELSAILNHVQIFSELIGKCVGVTYQMMTKGHLGGEQKVKTRLVKNARLDSNNSKTLKNLAEFIKDLEKISVGKVYLEILEKEESQDWLKNKRSEYSRASSGNDFEFAAEQAGNFSSSIEECKSAIQRLFDAAEEIEKLLEEIEKTSELQDEIEKVEP